jgi:hypothetical protein
MTTPGRAPLEKMCDPQLGQNTRVTGLPLPPVHVNSRVSPLSTSESARTAIDAECDPDALRQSSQ